MADSSIPSQAKQKRNKVISDSEEELPMPLKSSSSKSTKATKTKAPVQNPASDTTTLQQATKARCPYSCNDTEYTATGLLHHLQRVHKGHPDGKLSTRGIAEKYGIPHASEKEVAGHFSRRQTLEKNKKKRKPTVEESSDEEPAHKRPRTTHRSGKKESSPLNKENTLSQADSDQEVASIGKQKQVVSIPVKRMKNIAPAPITTRPSTPRVKRERTVEENSTGPKCPLKCFNPMHFTALGLLLHFKKSHKEHRDGKLNVKQIAAKYNAPEKSAAQIEGYKKRSANKWAKEAKQKAAKEKDDFSSAESEQDDDEEDESDVEEYIPKSIRQAASVKSATAPTKIIVRNTSGRMPLPTSKTVKKVAASPEPEPLHSPKRTRRTTSRAGAVQPKSVKPVVKGKKSHTSAEQVGDASPQIDWSYAEALEGIMKRNSRSAAAERDAGEEYGSSKKAGSHKTGLQKTDSQSTDSLYANNLPQTISQPSSSPPVLTSDESSQQASQSNQSASDSTNASQQLGSAQPNKAGVQATAAHPDQDEAPPSAPRRLCRSCGYAEVGYDRNQCVDCVEDGPLRMIAAEALIMMSRGTW